jgi:hypothetical protein
MLEEMRISWGIAALAACGGGSNSKLDAPPAVLDAREPVCWKDSATMATCDWSCVGVAWPTTAPDPIALTGSTQMSLFGAIGGATVTAYAVAGGTVLGTTTSSTVSTNKGHYTISVATGGTAPLTYRKVTLSGYLDGYGYDSTPAFDSAHADQILRLWDSGSINSVYQSFGEPYDANLGTLRIQAHDCAYNAVDNVVATTSSTALIGYDPNDPTATATKFGTIWVLRAPVGDIDVDLQVGSISYRAWQLRAYADAVTGIDRYP